MKNRFLIGMLGVLFSLSTSYACTDFRLKADDGSILISRTMEFAQPFKSNLRTSNRGRVFTETAPDGKPGMSWKAQYGYVFLDGLNTDFAIDGMNEKGLSIEALYLPGETQYQTVPAGHNNQALAYLHFGDWILSRFQNVDEVRTALPNVFVYEQPLASQDNIVLPAHFAIHDAAGKSLVVEFVGGKMNVFNNDMGVMTNSPTFDWQLTNLRNYINLSPVTPNPVVFGNLVFAATGQGAGMLGLPGDVSPPSRFVKIALMKSSIVPPTNALDALNVAQHIINNVDIPAGFVRAQQNGNMLNETTQWTIFKDLTNKIFYYKTYEDTTLHSVALPSIDFSEKAPRLKMPLVDSQVIVDMTKNFLQTKS